MKNRGDILKKAPPPLVLTVLFLLLIGIDGRFAHAKADKNQEEPMDLSSLTELPLESLLDIRVVSASKKEQRLQTAAAAVSVITAEDIRRSGAVSLAEVMRLAPGIHVTRSNAQSWSVTTRGFSQGAFANKMLVLIDGRSVYSPLFAGVFWDAQEIMLENVDRIEIIRGPGGALWGSNAVNGVINVITKKAEQTQGLLAVAGGGNEERGFGALRYGNIIGSQLAWRTYVRYFNRDNFTMEPTGINAGDESSMIRGGFRADWEPSDKDQITFDVDLYGGAGGIRQTSPTPTAPFTLTSVQDTNLSGGHLLTRWNRVLSEKSQLMVKAYYDRTNRETPTFKEDLNTLDLEAQYDLVLGRHALTVGSGYRFLNDNMPTRFLFAPDTSKNDIHLIQAFFQDDISLVRNKLNLIVGTKFEQNSYTNFEYQPTGRLLWTPRPNHTVWAAVSRAVRIPSRLEDNLRLNASIAQDPGTGAVTWISVLGNPSYGSETLLANEMGYRVQATERISFDLSAYLNIYDNLRTIELGTPFAEATPLPAHTVVPFTYGNLMDGKTYGGEVAAQWQVFDWWKLAGSYAFLKIDMNLDASSTDPISLTQTEGSSPKHQFRIRSFMDLPHHLEFDTLLYFVDKLESPYTPHYTRVDARIGWKPRENLTLSVVGQNLFDRRHAELRGAATSEVDRSVYGKITFQF